ncbi:nicotinate-nucleotide adenylyltransferase [Hansschlegelia sp. KR7-227]|uniref:nicotinate-nucleotide adenylyltransferase n=1 Tax=Hansschlegelia sp. KR7-227 TaxID=3400914 RepID=UPI003C08A990
MARIGERPPGSGRVLTPKLPPHAPGMAIGLYGGSFNPPHAAHRLVSRLALKRLELDRLWQLVTPGNPLKDNAALPALGERMAAAARLSAHPRVEVAGIEAAIGVRRSHDLVAHLVERCPGVGFVWIMGADNLATLHRWGRWRELAELVPIAVIDRPGATFAATNAPAAQTLARFRIDEADAGRLAWAAPPAWCFLHGLRSPLSSTALRGAGRAD